MAEKSYVCIDLKSFYASVECVDRGLDPLRTNLVVADESRTDKTICLAVSPSLKAYKISGRARLFEVKQRIREIYRETGKKIEFIIATPRMAKYEEVSSRIYSVYLKFISPEDIHVYSIDEVFIDVTPYLKLYGMDPHQITIMLVREVLKETGITATAGIGPNMYLAKIAMDIVAKHTDADKDGVRIAELDEMSYRRQLWEHKPMTDFWQIGSGIASRLERYGMFTMGDVARMSIMNEDLLFKVFGINAEILIDHAWGIEPTEIKDIKSYKPSSSSISSGQVLPKPYSTESARMIVMEMAEQLVFDLLDKKLVTDGIALDIGYDQEALNNMTYHGEIYTDWYGRPTPRASHGTAKLPLFTSSEKMIVNAVTGLYDSIVNRECTIRRINIAAIRLQKAESVSVQLDMFQNQETDKREEKLQSAMLELRHRFGNNSVLKAHDLEKDARTIERNGQIGGHRS